MRIIAHHTKYYDDVPVPEDVKVTEADLASGKVKPGARGGHLMRVTREPQGGTHTTILMPEHEIVAKVIEEKLRRNSTVTRKQAVALYLAEYTLPGHAHRSWITKFEVHDDGHDEPLMRSELERHVKAGNIDAEAVEGHVAAYKEPADAQAHVDHLHAHFRVGKAVA